MRHITCDQHLCDLGGGLDETASGAGDDRHNSSFGLPIAGDPDPDRPELIAEPGVDCPESPGECAVAPDARLPGLGVGAEWQGILQTEKVSQRVCRAVRRSVEIGVGDEQVDSGRDQPIGPGGC
jgi:hypothetical protein